MPRLINTRILGSPRNWLRIWLMAIIALVGFFLINRMIATGDTENGA